MKNMNTLRLWLVLLSAACAFGADPRVDAASPTKATPPQRTSLKDAGRLRAPPRPEELGRAPLNNYGSLEEPMQTLRAHRPLDLSSEEWRRRHAGGSYEDWARQARAILATGLHYDAGKLALNAVTSARWETDAFVRETIEFGER